jgi:hypothetical protein
MSLRTTRDCLCRHLDTLLRGAVFTSSSLIYKGVQISRFRRTPGYFRKFPDRMRSSAVSMGCRSICRMRALMY